MRRTSVTTEADMKPGNKKGTNPGPPDRTRRTRRTAIVLRTPPHVLTSTAANCGPPFGTKRPQVQILSPRLYSRRSEALTRVGEGLSCCQYRNEIPQVPQQIRTFDLLLKWVPPAGAALRSDEEAAGEKRFAATRVPAGHPRSRRPVVTGELQVDSSFGRSRLPIAGGGQGGDDVAQRRGRSGGWLRKTVSREAPRVAAASS